MNINFKDKVVIITGGSRGIGKELVKAFHREGARVYFTYVAKEKEAESLVDELKERVYGYKADNRVFQEVENFIKHIGNKEKRIDILINNAGIVPRFLFSNTSMKTWNDVIAINLIGVRNFCLASLKYLIRSENASIINISSVAADRPSSGISAYCATKGAIESLTRVLALELSPFKIRVNTIAPGLIETDVAKDITENKREEILARTPLKRFGKVEDVCNSALFIASDKASFITGAQLYITGGKHLN